MTYPTKSKGGMLDSNIQEIMEIEGATEVEARALYHLQEAFRALLEVNAQDAEVVDAESGIPKARAALSEALNRERYRDHYLALRNTILARIHQREHTLDE
jgi:DNA repair protein RadC